jgi:hypothetical protein
MNVLETRMLGGILGSTREKVEGGWRQFHNKELHNMYPSPGIIKMFKSRKMRRVSLVERTEEKQCTVKVSL